MRYHAYRIASSWKIASHARWDGGLLVTVADIIALPAFKNWSSPLPARERSGARCATWASSTVLPTTTNTVYTWRRTHPHEPRVRVRQPWHGREVAADDAAPRRGRHRRQNRLRASHQRRRAQGKHGARVPLYLYDGAYHETVAYQSLDLLQRDRDELDKARPSTSC